MPDYTPNTKQRAAVQMSPDEIRLFLLERRSMTMSTIGPDGYIHAVAMWYGVVDGTIGFISKRKAQKVVNLRRDSRLTGLVEAGESYSELRGVTLIGRARLDENVTSVEAIARSIFARYKGGTDTFDASASVRNRVAVWIEPVRTVSWDHRKLTGLPPRLSGGASGQEQEQ